MVEINLLDRSERKFVDRFEGALTGNISILYLLAGKAEYGFAFDVVLAKRLSKLLLQQVEAFEKASGQNWMTG